MQIDSQAQASNGGDTVSGSYTLKINTGGNSDTSVHGFLCSGGRFIETTGMPNVTFVTDRGNDLIAVGNNNPDDTLAATTSYIFQNGTARVASVRAGGEQFSNVKLNAAFTLNDRTGHLGLIGQAHLFGSQYSTAIIYPEGDTLSYPLAPTVKDSSSYVTGRTVDPTSEDSKVGAVRLVGEIPICAINVHFLATDFSGGSNLQSTEFHAYLRDTHGAFTHLNPPTGNEYVVARDINGSGWITGEYAADHSETYYKGFLYHDGTFTDIGSLGGAGTYPKGINSAGDVVGWSNTASGEHHAFLYHNGQMIDLNAYATGSSLTLTDANSIDDLGRISGKADASGLGTYGTAHAFRLAPVQNENDFDVNGSTPDLLWQDPQSGSVACWLMNGINLTTSPYLTSGVPLEWKIAGAADLSGDGKPDLLWRNQTTGDVACWLMNGTTFAGSVGVASGVPLDWQIVGTADFDDDGNPDLVWFNAATHTAAVWYMDGPKYYSSALLGTANGWDAAGVLPHRDDAFVTLLWRNATTGDLGYWNLNNNIVQSTGIIANGIPLDWQIAAIGDYNADGYSDIVWQNQSTGEAAIWYMNGTLYSGYNLLAQTSGTSWRIVGPK